MDPPLILAERDNRERERNEEREREGESMRKVEREEISWEEVLSR